MKKMDIFVLAAVIICAMSLPAHAVRENVSSIGRQTESQGYDQGRAMADRGAVGADKKSAARAGAGRALSPGTAGGESDAGSPIRAHKKAPAKVAPQTKAPAVKKLPPPSKKAKDLRALQNKTSQALIRAEVIASDERASDLQKKD